MNTPWHAGLCLLLGCAGAAQAQVTLTDPPAGWRFASPQQRDFLQEVHYPAADVNANGRSAVALESLLSIAPS